MWWRSHEFDGFDFGWLNVAIRLRFVQRYCYRFRADALLQTVKWQMLQRNDRNRWFAAIRLLDGLNFHSKSFKYDCDAHSNTRANRLLGMCTTHNTYGTRFAFVFDVSSVAHATTVWLCTNSNGKSFYFFRNLSIRFFKLFTKFKCFAEHLLFGCFIETGDYLIATVHNKTNGTIELSWCDYTLWMVSIDDTLFVELNSAPDSSSGRLSRIKKKITPTTSTT